MLTLVRAIWVAVAGRRGEDGDARAVGAAVAAGVAGFRASFVEGVLTLVRTIGMTVARAGGEHGNAWAADAAIFAVVGHRI